MSRSALLSWMFFALFSANIVISTEANAQAIQLSPEQQQMLDALPASQRTQAMQAISQLRDQQSGSAVDSINEPLVEPSTVEDFTGEVMRPSTIELSAMPRSRLVVKFALKEPTSEDHKRALDDDQVLSSLVGSQLFVLDESGVLALRGVEQIPLLGLTEADINRRLSAEPYLSMFDIDAKILGQKPIGVEALEPYGYDVFSPTSAPLSPATSGPVPSDYVLGPGDSVRIQLFGNVKSSSEHEVSRDGVLNLPEIGPVNVAGLSFSEFRDDINQRVAEMLIGTQVSVSMGHLRTIRVFVLGDVNQPGSHVVSGLATISSALYRSRGVSPIGSLRNIQLKRNGRIVSTFDAYDLLLKGDSSGDKRLRQGDVIFVPPIGVTVSVGGAVRRPAIYEVKRLTTAADLIQLVGGLKPQAAPKTTRLETISEDGRRTVLSVNLLDPSANTVRITSGDTLIVPEVLPEFSNAVILKGHVHRPGSYSWYKGMRLSDLIVSTDELKSGVDLDYVLVRRERERGQPIEAKSASLSLAFEFSDSVHDIQLLPNDEVNIFDATNGRQRIVAPLLALLDEQATIDRPSRHVQISGNVRAPGKYPLEDNMKVSDLIRAGGSLAESAYALEAELTSYSITQAGKRESKLRVVDLAAIRRGEASADLLLSEYDYLRINRSPDWNNVWTVIIEGEVVFPGEYRVHRGETLDSIIARAGGLTDAAFPEGAVFLRETLREQEQQQIESLARRMEADLATLSLQSASAGGSQTLSTGKVLLDQLRNTEATGRLVIDLVDMQNGRGIPLEVRDGDQLLIPTKTQVVTVLGESQQNTSHLYQSDMSRDDYIDRSGGLTRRADRKLIYIVRANGAVVAGKRSKWFGRSGGVDMRPGDTIVVPLDTDRMRPLTFWGNVTQILYQGAIAVAAVRTFNN